MLVRNYEDRDYEQVANLYKQGDLYGGQFDENRDSRDKLNTIILSDPEAILVCEEGGDILGTISIIEDGRVAWLFRFAVKELDNASEIIRILYKKAESVLASRGHKQILVYAPVNNNNFRDRYMALGFEQGSDYTCYWKDVL